MLLNPPCDPKWLCSFAPSLQSPQRGAFQLSPPPVYFPSLNRGRALALLSNPPWLTRRVELNPSGVNSARLHRFYGTVVGGVEQRRW